MTLPPQHPPFPVRPPYRVRPDLARLGAGASPGDGGPPTLVRVDAELRRYLAERRERLRDAPAEVRASAREVRPELLHAAGLALARAVARDAPRALRLDDDDVVLPHLGVAVDAAGDLRRAPGGGAERAASSVVLEEPLRLALVDELARAPWWSRRLEAITASVQEDVVLIGADGRAQWLHVAFPSGWDPGAMGGASFERLHGPVPHNDALLRAAPGLVRAMVHKGPFVRYVWGVSVGRDLDAHPAHRRTWTGSGSVVAGHALRVERQTTVPLAGLDLGAFLIHVYVTPLAEVVADGVRRAALADAIRSMDDELRRYKGLAGIGDALLAELDEPGAGAPPDADPVRRP